MYKIGILDSGGFNINSIKFALQRIGQKNISIVKNKNDFESCDKIIIPGVGSANIAMKKLKNNDLINLIKSTKKTTLGICLGMQIMCNYSQEFNTDCLGIFDCDVIHLPSNVISPQMGWNCLKKSKYENNYVYFANSFYAPLFDNTISFVEYGNIKISAIIKKDNFIGVQFHPEKSSKIGEQILKDFLGNNIC